MVELMGLVHGPTRFKPIKSTSELYKEMNSPHLQGWESFYSIRSREFSQKLEDSLTLEVGHPRRLKLL